MIKNIIFDLGNIIIKNPDINLVKEFFKNENDAKVFCDYIFKSEYWKLMDLGQITNEDIAKEIIENKKVNVTNYDEVRNFMLNWFTKRRLNNETVEIAKKLKENGYKIYLLSNMAKDTFEFLSKTYDFFNIADGEVISALVGIKKPDKKIFKLLIEKYNLNPSECLIIDDDDTNKTLEVANSFGINGRRVLPNNADDVVNLLKENGIVI